jgi:hypothetical protein
LNLHGLARSTEDLDIFVEPDAGNIERLRLALHDAIDDPDIDDPSGCAWQPEIGGAQTGSTRQADAG